MDSLEVQGPKLQKLVPSIPWKSGSSQLSGEAAIDSEGGGTIRSDHANTWGPNV